MNMILRVGVNAVGIWAAARLIDGITLSNEITSILLVAVIFGLANAFLRPLVLMLSLPAVVLTLGLFILVVNTAMLALTAWLSDALTIDGVVPAFLGALLISVISWVLSGLFSDD